MSTYFLLPRYHLLFLVCTIALIAIRGGLSLSAENGHLARIRSKRWVPSEVNIEEPVTPPVGGGSNEDGTKSRRSIQSRQANSSTQAPVDVETTPSTTTTSTTTPPLATTTTPSTTTATPVPTTLAPESVQQPMVNISDFLAMNYSYTDQTSFENGTNDWDFTGTWSKTNLSATGQDKRPVPLPMKEMLSSVSSAVAADASTGATNSTNATVPPDQNNFVMIYTVDEFSLKGFLRKSFGPSAYGEVFIRYYVVLPGTEFNVTLRQSDNTMVPLYSSVSEVDSAVVRAWTARRFQFTEQQTLNKGYTLVLSVAAPEGTAMGSPVLAVQHIAVGGMWPGGTPPTPTRPSNETVSPPGSAPYLESIANSIYTALYVFLAFFLLLILALIVVVVRGRLRQQAPRSADSDYDASTAYRLDKVYDNPSYDASSP